ncbi:hypothetical protein N7452_007929 [Penicillium brevicompactum]|uniref:F-box domain-containing protein n=1 Tax=Penicillium brevicompactum TaxID=5074 RepID=A0A9W9QJ15_PENBR|nr:hypothetical protein N7452_007929 [Penicillium brevicompactum]
MSLQSLPVEVIHLVLQFVGSDALRKQEACCLLVSKWWYNLAEPVLLKDLVLNANLLDKMPEDAFERLSLHAQRLTVQVTQASDFLGDEIFNDAICQLLSRCAYLKAFSFRAQSDFDPEHPMMPATNYLASWSPMRLFDILDLSGISDLVIDTCGSMFKSRVHICPRVLKIASLRSLRLRMHHICPRVLELESDSRIESIIINMSLMEPGCFHAGFSRHCTEPKSAYDLYQEMVTTATNVATSHFGIKMLRILSHKHPYSEIVTTDCIKGMTMILADITKDWEEDGLPDIEHAELSDRDLFAEDSEDDPFATLG